MAIEGITSPDGRVLGKMAHSERIGNGVAVNIFGEQDQKLFEAGVNYFRAGSEGDYKINIYGGLT